MTRRILIAPDKFKGSLSAAEAAEAIAGGVRRLDPGAELVLSPIADGGEGFMEAIATALPSRWIACPAVDALGRPVDTRYLLADTPEGPTAVLEMAEAAGLWRLRDDERDPLVATTRGCGMQMAHAIRHHAVKRIILGLGGSATNDGGAGMAAALGVAFLDASGTPVDPVPARMPEVDRVDFSSRLPLPEVVAACDVDNPLLGDHGATAVFSAQKGSTAGTRPRLEAALAHLVERSSGPQAGTARAAQAATTPGAGAAGGLGFGLLHFADARLVSGFDLVADLLDLPSRVGAADHVVTGEGSIDRQSLSGKGPVALARLAREHGVPVTGFCGLADDAARDSGLFRSLHALADTGRPLEELIAHAGPLLTELVAGSRFIDS